jgi:CRP/FNR family transcriptional regulator, cyclic AMP receptor protein
MPARLFQPGDVIFQPGDPAGEAYLIVSGSVEILARSGNRFDRVALCGPGDVFGEMSLIEERPRFLTARASAPCRATTMSRSEFEHFLTHNPERCLRYLQSLFGRLRESSERAAFTDGTKPQHPILVPVTIRPLTIRAAQSMAEKDLSVPRYPFQIGRAEEIPDSRAAEANDLSIQDSKPFNVSRHHAAIDLCADGSLVVVDRGSHLGTLVNGQRIGRDWPTRQAKLLRGDNVLVLGSRNSPFQFQITVGGSG